MSAILEEKQDTAPHVLFMPVMSGREVVWVCVSSMKPHEYTLYQCCPLSWGIQTDIQPPLKPWPAGRKRQSRSYLGLSRKPVYSGSNEDWWHMEFCCQYNQWSSPLLTHNSLPSVWACEQSWSELWDLSQFCSFQFRVREDFAFWKIKICVRSINVSIFSECEDQWNQIRFVGSGQGLFGF